jgi:hypothetical protein
MGKIKCYFIQEDERLLVDSFVRMALANSQQIKHVVCYPKAIGKALANWIKEQKSQLR